MASSARSRAVFGAFVALAICAVAAIALLGPDEVAPSSIGGEGDAARADGARPADAEPDAIRPGTRVVDAGDAREEVGSDAAATVPWPDDGVDLLVIDDATGRPVAGALVHFVDPRGHASGDDWLVRALRSSWRERLDDEGVAVRCDASGRTRVPYRTLRVEARASVEGGTARGVARIGSGAREPVVVRVAVREPWTVRVVDAAGAPAADASVVQFDGDGAVFLDRRRTDGDGLARFERRGAWTAEDSSTAAIDDSSVSFVLDGLFRSPVFERAFHRSEDHPIIELVRPPCGSVVVEVPGADALGRDELVTLGLAFRSSQNALDVRYTIELTQRLGDGELRFEQVGVGHALRVALGPDAERGRTTFAGPAADGEEVRVTIGRVEPGAVLFGRVVDEDGRAVADTRLELARLGHPFGGSGAGAGAGAGVGAVRSVTTRGDGSFEFRSGELTPRAWTALLRDPEGRGRTAPFRVPDAHADGRVDIGELVLVRALVQVNGRVLGHGGPLAGAEVTVAFVRSEPAWPIGEVYDQHDRIVDRLEDATGDALEVSMDEFVAVDRVLHTTEDGRFAFVAPSDARAAICSVEYAAHDDALFVVELPASSGTDLGVEIELQPRWSVEGRLVGAGSTYAGRAVEVVLRSGDLPEDADAGAFVRYHSGGRFSVSCPNAEPVGLALVTTSWPPTVLAELGPFAPSVDGAPHPALDPLDVASYADVFEVEVVPPFLGDEQPSTFVRLLDDEGQSWGAVGSSSGPWTLSVATPHGWGGAFTVHTNCYRPVTVRPFGRDVSVELELGPRVELAFEGLDAVPEGARWRLRLGTTQIHPDDEGAWSGYRPNAGAFVVTATLDLPRRQPEDTYDARWDELDGQPLRLARLELPDGGLSETIAMPDLDGLVELARGTGAEESRESR